MNANLQRFTGFADTYDRYRPALPLVVRDILSQLAHGFSEEEIGISDLRKAAEKILADRVVPWWWSYRMRVGIKESAVAAVNEGWTEDVPPGLLNRLNHRPNVRLTIA